MEAYELPKLIPTTGGMLDPTSAAPFGVELDMLLVVAVMVENEKKIKHVGPGLARVRSDRALPLPFPASTLGVAIYFGQSCKTDNTTRD